MTRTDRRWLLSVVSSFVLAVTMLWTPAVAVAAPDEGGVRTTDDRIC